MIGGQVDIGPPGFHPLHAALPVELNQDAVAAATQLLHQGLGRHTGMAAGGQLDERIGEASGAGETNLLIEPQAFPAEAGDVVEGLPGSVVGKTTVVTDGFQKPSNGRNGAVHLDSQGLDFPTGLLGKQGREAHAGLDLGTHMALLIMYCTNPGSDPIYALHYQASASGFCFVDNTPFGKAERSSLQGIGFEFNILPHATCGLVRFQSEKNDES